MLPPDASLPPARAHFLFEDRRHQLRYGGTIKCAAKFEEEIGARMNRANVNVHANTSRFKM